MYNNFLVLASFIFFILNFRDPTKNRNLKAKWWAWKELNFRPHAYQACALTTELQARRIYEYKQLTIFTNFLH